MWAKIGYVRCEHIEAEKSGKDIYVPAKLSIYHRKELPI